MTESPLKMEEFLTDVVSAWEELAPEASFAGFTLAEFKAKVKPSFDTRTEVSTLATQLKAARQSRNNADAVSNDAALNVVNGVRSAPGFGENSALYKALGYVPKNERKSGLVRPSTNTVTTLKAA
jgi:hypothetical protein